MPAKTTPTPTSFSQRLKLRRVWSRLAFDFGIRCVCSLRPLFHLGLDDGSTQRNEKAERCRDCFFGNEKPVVVSPSLCSHIRVPNETPAGESSYEREVTIVRRHPCILRSRFERLADHVAHASVLAHADLASSLVQ
jgi:hypothetical protein